MMDNSGEEGSENRWFWSISVALVLAIALVLAGCGGGGGGQGGGGGGGSEQITVASDIAYPPLRVREGGSRWAST